MPEPPHCLEERRGGQQVSRRPSSEPVVSADILRALRRRYASGWGLFPEVQLDGRLGKPGGWTFGNCSRVDLLAVAFTVGNRLGIEAIEIKVSRADFLAEMRDPQKRVPAERIANACWFALPHGVADVAEIPDPWGLYYYREGKLRMAKRAQYREQTEVPRWLLGRLAFHARPHNEHEQRVRDTLRMARWFIRCGRLDRADQEVRGLQRPEDREITDRHVSAMPQLSVKEVRFSS